MDYSNTHGHVTRAHYLPGINAPLLADGGGVGGERRRERALAHEVTVDRGRARTAFRDRPHDEALAAAHVAAHEHVVNVRAPAPVARDVAALVQFDAELLE